MKIIIEDEDVIDPTIIKYRAKVKDSKGVIYTFIQSSVGYRLYDEKGKRFAETTSVQEWDT